MRKTILGLMLGLCLLLPAAPSVAASPAQCQAYAKAAQHAFLLMQKYKRCQVPVSKRWQPVYKIHYNWCLGASQDDVDAEARIRDRHLVKCGARTAMSNPGMKQTK